MIPTNLQKDEHGNVKIQITMSQSPTKTNQGFDNNPHHKPLFNPDQQFCIVSGLDQSMCLDVSEDPKSAGQLILWKKHGKKNQRFRIIPQGNRYCITSSLTLNPITINKNSSDKGQYLFTQPLNCLQSQLWQFNYAKGKDERFYIKNSFNKYLDVFQGRSKNGVAIIQWDFNGNKNQVWKMVPV